ncbi:MAG TPA: metal-dependent hydrolase [Candidatus Binatia bacterium]|nr:metal-dependent hydrolase [Candidatus Binatia bacterium]
MPAETASPESLEIAKRDIEFEFPADMRRWHPEGLHVTHFYNALSLFFPEGESFFIDAVRHYKHVARDPKLAEEVKGFLGQEAMHSREHRRYNRALNEAGLPAKALEDRLLKHLDLVRESVSPAHALAITIALEHFTAILAHVLLSDDRILGESDPRMAAIWRWHAIEETEHKAVAYDVYQAAVGEGLRAYLLRVSVMLMTTAIFWAHVSAYHFALIRREGAVTDVRGWWRLVRFLWIKPGGMWRMWRMWLEYFRPSFHPWQHDNHDYVDAWKAAYAQKGAVPA